jgi:tetratricopeptide (TPR) repeat protein
VPSLARPRALAGAAIIALGARGHASTALLALAVLLLLGVLTSAAAVRAQDPAAAQARTAFERGVSASQEGRWDEARLEFQRSRAFVIKPSTLLNLAVANVKLGRASEALEALDAFAQIANPTEHAAMLERAAALRADAERMQEAARPAGERVRALLEPVGLPPPARAAFATGRDAFAHGDDKQALDAFSLAYEQSGRAELLYDIGVVCDRLREDERAVEAFRAFIEKLPQLPEAELAQRRVERLEQVLRERGRPESNLVAAEAAGAARSAAPPRDLAPANLTAPRTLIVLGATLAGASIGTAQWWAQRDDAVEACEAPTPPCENGDTIRSERAAAIAVTLALDAAAITLMVSGGAWLARRKRASRLGLGPGLRVTF